MINDLQFFRGEATKLQELIRKDSGRDYKRYATLLQAYITARGNVNQLEAYKRQQEEQRQRETERNKIIDETIKEDKKKKAKAKK